MEDTALFVVAFGAATPKRAPFGGGLNHLGFADNAFNTIWHRAQLLEYREGSGFVTRIGTATLSDRSAAS